MKYIKKNVVAHVLGLMEIQRTRINNYFVMSWKVTLAETGGAINIKQPKLKIRLSKKGKRMKKLTEKDEQGNWCLKGVPWKTLRPGQVLTKDMSDKIYAALWKLMEYEGTGLTPDEIMDGKMLTGWIPVEERLPDENTKVLVWYECFRYGKYNRMIQDFGIGCIYENGFCEVNGMNARCLAWMPTPELY